MHKPLACALVALVLVSTAAHAARHDRILLILPESGQWREDALAYWNDGVGLEVDIVLDPALGIAQAGPHEGMLAAFDATTPGAEWVVLRVSEPGDLAAQLATLDAAGRHVAAMGPFEAFSDDPADAYAQCDAVIVTTGPMPGDGDRAAFVAQARIVATQAKAANPHTLLGTNLEPAAGHEEPLLAAQKLFADTRGFLDIFAVDVAALGPEGIALVESVATAPAPRSGGMYMDMMQRPSNILDPTKEVWMQRGAMVLGVLTILGVILIVRFKRPPEITPPKAG